ncbi:MAG: hypothetical protein D6732_00290 [Methanobacteriota archaeon]|nr:MAG: hypothetical protein D6732_00290 [Euryarchaeota archaeon]
MFNSLKALLSKVIDYAGLFPPAKLPLETAMSNYLKYLDSEDNWMISRFVLPFGKIEDLRPYYTSFGRFPQPVEFSILGRGGMNIQQFGENLYNELQALSKLQETENVDFRMMEIKLPPSVFGEENPGDLMRKIEEVSEPFPAPKFYLEIQFIDNWQTTISKLSEFAVQSPLEVYFKVRTGGVEASMIPPSSAVAHFIHLCKEHGMAFKATAGLHHPFRHYSPSVKTKMHGFLNLLIGTALDLEVDQLIEILNDEQPNNFKFWNDKIEWKGHELTIEQIQMARKKRIHSFGSCSFEEPKEDLIELRLW